MADFEPPESPKLISRKVWVIEKLWNFNTVHFQLFVYKTHHLLTKNTTRDRAMPTITVTMTTIDRSTGMLRAVWTLEDERKNPPFWLVWTEVLSSFGTQVKSTGVHEPFWRHWLSTRRVRLAEKKNGVNSRNFNTVWVAVWKLEDFPATVFQV